MRRTRESVGEFHAKDAFESAHARHEFAERGGLHAPRWVPIAAAVLALLAASTGLVANLRVTQSSAAKSDAIIFITRAADAYNEFGSRSVRQHIYEAALEGTTDPRRAAHLRSIAEHEKQEKAPLLQKARTLDERSRAATDHAEHILTSHEILSVATTLFEIAIVLVSVTALVGSRLLPIAAAIATAAGLAIALRGLLY
jgi:small-conductance mechanosensitive channel